MNINVLLSFCEQMNIYIDNSNYICQGNRVIKPGYSSYP
jgi:hypothetical protein